MWYVFLGIALLVGGFTMTHFSFTILFTVMGVMQTSATLTFATILFKDTNKKVDTISGI